MIMTPRHRWLWILIFFSFVAGTLGLAPPVQAQPESLTIAAANSLRDTFRKVLPLFEAQHPEITVRIIYGPSQTLRSQIEQGAPVDVFLPSLFEEIEWLEKNGLVIQGTKHVYASTSSMAYRVRTRRVFSSSAGFGDWPVPSLSRYSMRHSNE